MQAKDIMTDNVITVREDTPVDDIAGLLLKHRISGMPVVDEKNNIVGLVSEGDLMRQPGIEAERPRSWWLQLMTSSQEQAADFIKSHGLRAEQVMTRNIITVNADTGIADIAQLLEKHRIKRVPVVENGKLVGIISRANLLQALAAHRHGDKLAATAAQDDRTIRQDILAAIRKKGWLTHGSPNVIVSEGRVEIWGWVDSEDERRALLLAVESIPGVRKVEDHLGSLPAYLRNI